MVSEVHGHPVRHLGGLQRVPAGARLRGRAHPDRRPNPSSRKCSSGAQPSHKVSLIISINKVDGRDVGSDRAVYCINV